MPGLISIIVPCYNQACYLNETLDSVRIQTYTDWECIIVNDGSTDDTENVAMHYVTLDQRFKYLKKVNGGLSSARNSGLKIAKGDFIQFLDSDDTIHENKFSLQLEQMKSEVDISICDYKPFNTITKDFVATRYLSPFLSEKYFKYEIIKHWEFRKSIPCHSVLFKSNLLKKSDPLLFDETLSNHEDWVFWVKLFSYARGIHNMQIPLAFYRIHNTSMCTDVNRMRKGFLKANKKLMLFFDEKNETSSVNLLRLKEKEIRFYYPTKWGEFKLRVNQRLKNMLN